MKELVEAIKDSEKILIGLGKEWTIDYDTMLGCWKQKSMVLYELFQNALEYEKNSILVDFYQWFFYKNDCPKNLECAYQKLYELVKEKDYFILSLSTDSYLEKFGFDSDKFVNPCGTMKLMQCNQSCDEDLYLSDVLLQKAEMILIDAVDKNDQCSQDEVIAINQSLIELLSCIKCQKCADSIVFNTLDAVKYNENGYLNQWQRYMQWLQKTINKDLCILEAGVGMEFPSVVRWPFEKTAFYNQKALYYRINEKFYQTNEEISKRSLGIEANSLKYLADI